MNFIPFQHHQRSTLTHVPTLKPPLPDAAAEAVTQPGSRAGRFSVRSVAACAGVVAPDLSGMKDENIVRLFIRD
jgi:hypothetical protein